METFDYIVVGAGTAGCVVAARLSEDPGTSVLLLEAGGPDNHPLVRMPLGFLKALQKPALTWGYTSEPEPQLGGRSIPIPRGRLLGGSSSINGMFHIRGHASDFDGWRDLGCTGWGYDEVLPYFKRGETNWRGEGTYHGGSGPLAVNPIDDSRLLADPLRQAAAAAGWPLTDDYDGAVQEGFARGEVAIDRRGRRASSARAYLHPNMDRPNLTVLTHALTQRVVIQNNRAVGVVFEHKGRKREVRVTREVILCGGAYNTPKLLMLSGIGPADDLQQHGITPVRHLPGVGRNLMEHPRMAMLYRATRPVTFTNYLRFDVATWSVLRWALTGKGPFATQISSGTLLLKTRPELTRPDIQLLCNPVSFDARLWFPGVVAPVPHSFYITVCLLRQKSRGQVTLRSGDPAASPRIYLNLFSDADDLAVLREGVRATRTLYRAEPQGSLTGQEVIPGAAYQSDAELDDAIRLHAGITHHPVGTCRMGIGPDAVVDPRLRVIGVDGLRVADASIMPTIPGANTNAATLMIAEKAADLIRRRQLPAAQLPPQRQAS